MAGLLTYMTQGSCDCETIAKTSYAIVVACMVMQMDHEST